MKSRRLDSLRFEGMVSREHCRFRFDHAERLWTVEDMGSQNMTYVNRRPVFPDGPPTVLKDGDVLCVGRWRGQYISDVCYRVQLS